MPDGKMREPDAVAWASSAATRSSDVPGSRPRLSSWPGAPLRAAGSNAAVVAGAFLVMMVGFGASYSFAAFAIPLAAFIVESFGTERAGAEIGLIYTSRAVALLAGPPLAALASDGPLGAALPIGGVALLGMLGTLLLARAARMAGARAA